MPRSKRLARCRDKAGAARPEHVPILQLDIEPLAIRRVRRHTVGRQPAGPPQLDRDTGSRGRPARQSHRLRPGAEQPAEQVHLMGEYVVQHAPAKAIVAEETAVRSPARARHGKLEAHRRDGARRQQRQRGAKAPIGLAKSTRVTDLQPPPGRSRCIVHRRRIGGGERHRFLD